MKKNILICFLLLGLCACQAGEEEKSEVEELKNTWLKERTASFTATVPSLEHPFAQQVELTLSNEAYQQLDTFKIAITTTSPSKRQWSKKYEIPVKGQSTVSTKEGVKLKCIVSKQILFKETGTFTFLITPFSSQAELDGILDIDFKIGQNIKQVITQ